MSSNITIREFKNEDIEGAIRVWNEVVRDGIAFPQVNELTSSEGLNFFKSQTYTGVAVDENSEVVGLYIVHPNNIGRCGHIANASYAVSSKMRGQHIGEKIVRDSLSQAKKSGFRIMQFNAVVATNASARHLYEKIGFKQLGTICGGFKEDDGTYVDICPYYIEL